MRVSTNALTPTKLDREFFPGQGGNVDTVQIDLPVRWFDQPVYTADKGRFSASGEPHNYQDLPLVHFEAQILDRRGVSVILG